MFSFVNGFFEKSCFSFVLEEISSLSVVIFILFCYNTFNYGVVCRLLVFDKKYTTKIVINRIVNNR